MLDILTVAGARPNFIKVAALHHAFSRSPYVRPRICHTGQHYDEAMSGVFFDELKMPMPDVFLGVGGGSHAQQTGRIMEAFEAEVQKNRPDVVVVVGDVNSTLACTLVCSKLQIPVAHVEAGLRSEDRSMPEEINRIVTDVLSDHLFVTERSGLDNLRSEGIPVERIHFVGNVMIDSLVRFKDQAVKRAAAENLGCTPGGYILLTMHRPATVDVPEQLEKMVRLVEQLATRAPIVFPVHPRTRQKLAEAKWMDRLSRCTGISLIPPCGYLDFLSLMSDAALVVTDSGGAQEETTYLGVPCITLRPNTERPVTTELGTNVLMPLDVDAVLESADRALSGGWKKGHVPPLWDGNASTRIARILVEKSGSLLLRKRVPRAVAAHV